jgi:hypothetical protein
MYHIIIHSLIRISMFLHTKPTTIFIGFLNVINVIFIKIVLFCFVKIVVSNCMQSSIVMPVKKKNNWRIKIKWRTKSRWPPGMNFP